MCRHLRLRWAVSQRSRLHQWNWPYSTSCGRGCRPCRRYGSLYQHALGCEPSYSMLVRPMAMQLDSSVSECKWKNDTWLRLPDFPTSTWLRTRWGTDVYGY